MLHVALSSAAVRPLPVDGVSIASTRVQGLALLYLLASGRTATRDDNVIQSHDEPFLLSTSVFR